MRCYQTFFSPHFFSASSTKGKKKELISGGGTNGFILGWKINFCLRPCLEVLKLTRDLLMSPGSSVHGSREDGGGGWGGGGRRVESRIKLLHHQPSENMNWIWTKAETKSSNMGTTLSSCYNYHRGKAGKSWWAYDHNKGICEGWCDSSCLAASRCIRGGDNVFPVSPCYLHTVWSEDRTPPCVSTPVMLSQTSQRPTKEGELRIRCPSC